MEVCVVIIIILAECTSIMDMTYIAKALDIAHKCFKLGPIRMTVYFVVLTK